MKVFLYILFTIFILVIPVYSKQWNPVSNNFTTGKLGVGTNSVGITGTSINNLVIGDGSSAKGLVVNAGTNHNGILAFANNGVLAARFIYNNASGDLKFSNTNSALFTIKNSGKIGIGTMSPKGKLDVTGLTYLKAAPTHSTESEQLRIGRADLNVRYHSIYSNHSGGTASNYLQFRIHDGYDNNGAIRQAIAMTLNGQGKVGIGTNNLSISGTGVNDLVIGNGTSSRGLVINAGSNNDAVLSFASNSSLAARFIYNNPSGKLHYHKPETGNLFTITNSGKVGIGTTNPKGSLDISGLTYLKAAPTHSIASEQLRFGRADLNVRYHSIYSNHSGSAANNYLQFRVHDGYDENGAKRQSTVMTMNGKGFVGIGTASPSQKLDVNGYLKVGGTNTSQINLADRGHSGSHAILFNAYPSPTMVNGELGSVGNTKFANNKGNYNGGAAGIFFNGNGGNMYIRISGNSTGRGKNIDWGAPEFTIKRNGNIGIGTTAPKNKLSVNGTIWAKEVVVSLTDAADWVFNDDYILKPLEEVEAFINSNKHLPDVPSADEFRENDLNVAQMDNKLLQKIEELTLYLIKMNKQIKVQNMEIQLLKTENKYLSSKIKN